MTLPNTINTTLILFVGSTWLFSTSQAQQLRGGGAGDAAILDKNINNNNKNKNDWLSNDQDNEVGGGDENNNIDQHRQLGSTWSAKYLLQTRDCGIFSCTSWSFQAGKVFCAESDLTDMIPLAIGGGPFDTTPETRIVKVSPVDEIDCVTWNSHCVYDHFVPASYGIYKCY